MTRYIFRDGLALYRTYYVYADSFGEAQLKLIREITMSASEPAVTRMKPSIGHYLHVMPEDELKPRYYDV